MTLEAFFAVVLGAAFLHEELGPIQLAGGLAILVAAALVAGRRAVPAPTALPVVFVPETVAPSPV
jgi:drug/metabolite transporter (DMT)-like permease